MASTAAEWDAIPFDSLVPTFVRRLASLEREAAANGDGAEEIRARAREFSSVIQRAAKLALGGSRAAAKELLIRSVEPFGVDIKPARIQASIDLPKGT